MSISFKQFSQAYDAALADGDTPGFLEEGPIWDKIKAAAKGTKPAGATLSDQELEALHDKSVKGDMKSRKTLTDYFRTQSGKTKLSNRAIQVKNTTKANDRSLDDRFSNAKAHIEAGERGSSRAFDRERGSAHRTPPRWDPEMKQWAPA